ncbi:hypothetical protein GNI_060030 [Gregarina niphandrodes]|uniref:Uncharacterized protein n=1 Tax=Gregarina niphandrodes TaxID=110365 RepID=A0A023B8E4_GRENI|nr:hypothetical protein GNI_060030 [Gregarina niphandrodes]EZG69096.1 hypothetical protein GNI_060030 [Gregarina niphandrodes]|eukprot:XP_011134501.1 hypothetical protein GNI_060030 [Gregarina niphandrodes]
MRVKSFLLWSPVLAKHYVVSNPAELSVCHILQFRIGLTKFASLLFNGDTLMGNMQSLHEALQVPETWERVNSLSTPPKSASLLAEQGRSGHCAEIDEMVESLATRGGEVLTGGDPSAMLTQLPALIDSHLAILNATALGIDHDVLRAKFIHSSVATPLAVVIPSCTTLPFGELDADGDLQSEESFLYNWNTAMKLHGKEIFSDFIHRLQQCNGCFEDLLSKVAQEADVSIDREKTASLSVQGLTALRSALEANNFEDVPPTTGGVIGFMIAHILEVTQGRVNPAALSKAAEDLIAMLSALNEEVINGPRVVLPAYEEFYHAMGC